MIGKRARRHQVPDPLDGPQQQPRLVALAQSEINAGNSEDRFGTQGGTGSHELSAPTKPGKYELRYVLRERADHRPSAER